MRFLQKVCVVCVLILSSLLWAEECPYKVGVVRSKDPNKRIAGLEPAEKLFPIQVNSTSPLEFQSKIEFVFESAGRTLVYNESPVGFYPLASGKQAFNLVLKMNSKATPLKLIAISSDGDILEEDLIVAVPFFQHMQKDPYTPPPKPKPKRDPKSLRERPYVPSVLFGPYYSFFRVDGTDATNGSKASVLSRSNLGVLLAGSVRILKRYEPRVSLMFTTYTVTPLDGRSFDSTASQALINAGVGFGYYPAPPLPLSVGLGISYFEETVLRSVDATTMRLEKLGLPRIALNATYTFFEKRRLSLGGDLLLYYMLGKQQPDFTYNSAFGYSVEAFAGYKLAKLVELPPLRNQALRGSIYFHQRKSTTTITNQNKIELGISVKWIFSF